jgi:hypothetical protein
MLNIECRIEDREIKNEELEIRNEKGGIHNIELMANGEQ